MDAVSPTVFNLIIFVLAIYVGYHVVWTVTPALHTPLTPAGITMSGADGITMTGADGITMTGAESVSQ